jgi:MFS family permease
MTKLLGRNVRREVVIALAFVAGVMACLISGTLYAVSLWLPLVKEQLHFTQTQTNLVAGAGSLGQYLGFISGLLNDLTSSRIAMLAGAAALGIGYGLLALAAGRFLGDRCPWWLVAGFLFLAGLGR